MKILVAIALAVLVATPAAADWSPGRDVPGRTWHPDTNFPSTPAIQRYGTGRKGMKRFERGMIRDAEYHRSHAEDLAIRPAAAGMEDARGRCDRVLKAALDGGDRQEIEEARDRCKPRSYGPQLR